MRHILILLIFYSANSYSQKFYGGFGMALPVFHYINTDYTYTSDSPYSFDPFKLNKSNQVNGAVYDAQLNSIYWTFSVRIGYQHKSSFFELDLIPFGEQGIKLKGTRPDGYSAGYVEDKVSMLYNFGGAFFVFKQVVSGRKMTGISPTLAYGIQFPYKLDIKENQSGYAFFDFEKSIYQVAKVGLELSLGASSIEFRQSFYLNNISPDIRHGFFEIGLKSNIYSTSISKHNRVFLGE